MDNKNKQPYEVGYKRPPQNKRFRPGQSGNPKGRPKGAKNLGSLLMKELNTRILVTENGRQKTMTKQQAIVKGTVNNAVRGDHKATSTIWADLKSREENTGGSDSTSAAIPIAAEDELVMESIIQRIRNSAAPSLTEVDPTAEREIDRK